MKPEEINLAKQQAEAAILVILKELQDYADINISACDLSSRKHTSADPNKRNTVEGVHIKETL